MSDQDGAATTARGREIRSQPHPWLIPEDWSAAEIAEEHESRLIAIAEITAQLAERADDGTAEHYDWYKRARSARAILRVQMLALRAEMFKRGMDIVLPPTEQQMQAARAKHLAKEEAKTLRAQRLAAEAVLRKAAAAEKAERIAANIHKQRVQRDEAAVARAERQKAQDALQARRERRFIDAARAVLSPETWTRLWAEVDAADAP